MLSDDVRRTVADALRDAEVGRRPIPPLRETWAEIDVVDAYEIQLLNIRQRLEAGAGVRGHKVGLSSKAMQEMMGVDEPDYGHLLSDMAWAMIWVGCSDDRLGWSVSGSAWMNST